MPKHFCWRTFEEHFEHWAMAPVGKYLPKGTHLASCITAPSAYRLVEVPVLIQKTLVEFVAIAIAAVCPVASVCAATELPVRGARIIVVLLSIQYTPDESTAKLPGESEDDSVVAVDPGIQVITAPVPMSVQ